MPDVLAAVERRVLWLSTAIVDHANRVRPRGEVKAGGHQASSASLVSAMTALWFTALRAEDLVSVKPHASPVLHAINYLLGDLPEEYLTTLRERGGLQSYPSRRKDPDRVDFSTGSVGLGATAPLWQAVAARYVGSRRGTPLPPRRHIALLGDAELDEGAIWEAVADPAVAGLGELLWIVDVNRQSLDRVVPGDAVTRWQGMFAAAGWEVAELKYGRRLRRRFARAGGDDLRRLLDDMPNEEFQALLRAAPEQVRARLGDDEAAAALTDLGGHDLADLTEVLGRPPGTRPAVVFAYTIKGFGLPLAGHPANHSALLTAGQMRELAGRLGADPDQPWARFPDGSPEAELCAEAAARLRRPARKIGAALPVPEDLGLRYHGRLSTQASLGRFLLALGRAAPEVAARVVTVSPDVASSTNLGGWINKAGVWNVRDRPDHFAADRERLLRWIESPAGQHIELGIAETNLVGLLAELGTTWERWGERLLPIGTVYDPFVGRALEPWSFGMYAGGQSILIATPSGVTLAPEGGAHQSALTPLIGIGQPECVYYEPAFAADLEWILLDALSRLGVPGGSSTLLRLSTRPVDQALTAPPDDPAGRDQPGRDSAGRDQRRRDCLAGGYRLVAPDRPAVRLAGAGAVLPEVLAAADRLAAEHGAGAEVICVTSPDLLFRDRRHRDRLFTPALPLVTVLDGHPLALAFLHPAVPLGVTTFGQSTGLADAYRLHGLDTTTIVDAALTAMSSDAAPAAMSSDAAPAAMSSDAAPAAMKGR